MKYEVKKEFELMSECLFPMFHTSILLKLNFTSSLFGKMEKIKDFRNFLIKNRNIIGINYLKNNDGLSIFEY